MFHKSLSLLESLLDSLFESENSLISPQVSNKQILDDLSDLENEGLELEHMKESITTGLLEATSRLEFLAQKYDLEVSDVERIKIADPTPNSAYLDWILRQVREGNLKFPEDEGKVSETLSAFDSLKRKSTFSGEKDINQYKGFGDLWDAVEVAKNVLGKKENVRKLQEDGVKILTGDWQNGVIEVTTAEAGAKLFRDTAWCVKDPKYFKHYKPNRYYLFLQSGKRVALYHPETRQFKSTNDAQIPLKRAYPLIDLLSSSKLLPTVSQAKYHFIRETGNKVINSLALMAEDPELLKEFVNELEKEKVEKINAKSTDLMSLKALRTLGEGPWVEAVNKLTDRELRQSRIYNYSLSDNMFRTLVSKSPRIQEHLSSLPGVSTSIRYALLLGITLPKEIEDRICNRNIFRADRGIFRDGSMVIDYAALRGGRWPELEKLLLDEKQSDLIIEYAKKVVGGRWPEAEPVILRYSDSALKYIKDVIKGRWPEFEDSRWVESPETLAKYKDILAQN